MTYPSQAHAPSSASLSAVASRVVLSAFELAARGQQVLLLERATIAAAASKHNTGTLLSQGEPEVMQLLRLSMRIYKELEAGPFAFHFSQRPQLVLAGDAAQLAAARQRAEQIRHLGGALDAADGEGLRRLFPPLREQLAGGYVTYLG